MFGKWQRYRSVMLVGEEGRVIPFRRFKEIAIVVSALALFSTIALALLGVLYFLQGQMVARLQGDVHRLQHQVRVLKDQKDVLRAQLVIRSIQKNTEPKTAANAPATISAENTPRPAIKTKHVAAAEPAHHHHSVIHWKADIRHFQVKYDAGAGSLKAKFRIYNTSTPRKRLSGHIVLAFKASGDPPIKWLAVPDVLFVDGRPSGERGRAFSVRNYRTMEFRTGRQKTPIPFNTATVYVYSSDGELLLMRDFDFKIPPVPAPSKAPPPTAKTEPGKPASQPSGKSEQPTAAPAQTGGAAADSSGAQSKPPEPGKVDSASALHHQTQAVQEPNGNSHTSSPKENGSERQ